MADQDDRRARVGSAAVDYWFDLYENDTDGKVCVTYAYGLEIDRRSSHEASFTDLMRDALPAIQADIDAYGIST